MNKFDEFDLIETPDDWKNIDFHQKPIRKKNSYGIAIMSLCIVIIVSSVGLVYAYNENFRLWIQQQFHIQNLELFSQPMSNKKMRIEGSFLYYYFENGEKENIDEMFIFKNGKYIKKDIQTMKGKYNSESYSFNYVKNEDNILTFNEEGFFQYSLDLLDGDILYFSSRDNNLCSLNMKTGSIEEITNDQELVNFSISPEKTYFLINKDDKYWTVYNTKTKTEKRLNALNPYAHNNEYHFMNDYQLIAFNNEDLTCIINLETLEILDLNIACLYPNASTLTLSVQDDQTTIYNHLNHQQYTLEMNLESYNYSVEMNRYLILRSFKYKEIVIVDFDNQQYKKLDYVGTDEIIDILLLDEDYLVIYNDEDYYILSIKEIFKDNSI